MPSGAEADTKKDSRPLLSLPTKQSKTIEKPKYKTASAVLLLCEYAALNGAERSLLAALDGVCAAGFDLLALAPPQGPLADALREKHVPVVPWQLHEPSKERLPQDMLRQRLAEELARLRPALLHANSLSMGRLSGPVAAAAGIPGITHLRDIVRLSRRAIADLNCHARLLAVSESTRRFHVAAGLDAAKCRVLYNGVDLDRFRPRLATGFLHRELGLAPESVLVGTIGQISLRKGQDVLARAACALADELPHVHYLVIGERLSEKAESRQFEADLRAVAEGPLSGRLHFLGVRGDVDRVLNELALLVHPARQEPMGRVLLEAAAAGVAVIATDVGGTREVFPPDEKAARLVPADDSEALAAAIGTLVADSSLRGRLGLAACRRAERLFSADRSATVLAAHYQDVIEHR
ncbi:MAG: glycosyltransferase family 4 protein [Rhodopirellula sp.]|nr:glycosyltransferase family 4 protein [Rhodopirellula sp.]